MPLQMLPRTLVFTVIIFFFAGIEVIYLEEILAVTAY